MAYERGEKEKARAAAILYNKYKEAKENTICARLIVK